MNERSFLNGIKGALVLPLSHIHPSGYQLQLHVQEIVQTYLKVECKNTVLFKIWA